MTNESNDCFLEAWKEAVELAGHAFFGDGSATGVCVARDKNQLRPKWDAIEHGFGRLSRGEQFLLAHMLTFFNPDRSGWANQKYVSRLSAPTFGEASAALDLERRAALARLLMNYQGW